MIYIHKGHTAGSSMNNLTHAFATCWLVSLNTSWASTTTSSGCSFITQELQEAWEGKQMYVNQQAWLSISLSHSPIHTQLPQTGLLIAMRARDPSRLEDAALP